MPQINGVVILERRGEVAVLTLDNPPVNLFDQAARAGLMAGLGQALGDAAVKAVVIRSVGRLFTAGSDIHEFEETPKPPTLRDLLQAIEDSPKPVVAAVHGIAMGGGLELAMACSARVAGPGALLGLPEVNIGIVPGAGGTQRLPRLVGVDKALDMMLSGAPIGAKDALANGLVDAGVEGDLADAAVAHAQKIVAQNRGPRRVRDMDDKIAPLRGNTEIFEARRKAIARRTRGFRAPAAIIDAVEAAVNLPFDHGMAREGEIYTELLGSPEAKAQRYFFFAEREAAKIPDLKPGTAAQPISRVAIIGAGTMGGGIAMACANVGLPVTLIEAKQDNLDRGLATIRKNYARSLSRGSLTQDQFDTRMALITPSLKLEDIAAADLVLEAVFENLQVKKDVFAEIDKYARAGAVLATNTSTLDVDAIAAATGRPQSVIGLHFFSPANVMRLVEVVRGADTSDAVIATAMAFGKRLRKVPVLVRVCFGFVGNRIMFARAGQSVRLPLEGASPAAIDKALTDFGLPMGHLAMMDLGGLDIDHAVRQERGEAEPIVDALVARGHLGQKTGLGFYRYDKADRTPQPNPEVDDIIADAAKAAGIAPRSVGEQEMLERQLFPMVNEAAKILEEGIAIRPSDIDVIWVYGYGWPIYRGGLTYWADQVGLKTIRDKMLVYHRETGAETFKPAALLNRLADAGKGFADFAAEGRAP